MVVLHFFFPVLGEINHKTSHLKGKAALPAFPRGISCYLKLHKGNSNCFKEQKGALFQHKLQS